MSRAARRALAALTVGLALTSALVMTVAAAPVVQGGASHERWSAEERAALASMLRDPARSTPADPSNAYERDPRAAALGRRLFDDTAFSRNGEVACATCHAADRDFQDGRPTGQGVGRGARRTMPVMGAAHAPFLFWDGRKDSLWSQALGPLEDAAEHGSNRVRIVSQLRDRYREPYRAVFGDLPSLEGLPADASPKGDAAERAAWAALPAAARNGVNRAFANMGKAIAAFERQLAYGPSRFDRFVAATLAGDRATQQAVMSAAEVRGLRVFLGRGQCATCHNGPELSDHAFHNTGVPPAPSAAPDRGRVDGVRQLLGDEFNCLGRYSDANPAQCGELQFLANDNSGQLGALRTPSLRNVAQRAPYMHAGQLPTLEAVVRHYASSPRAAVGRSELARPGDRHAEREPIRLSDQDVDDLVAFLHTLSGPVTMDRALAPVASVR